jgi:hypothetical protein
VIAALACWGKTGCNYLQAARVKYCMFLEEVLLFCLFREGLVLACFTWSAMIQAVFIRGTVQE